MSLPPERSLPPGRSLAARRVDGAVAAAIAVLAVWNLLRTQIHDENVRVVLGAVLGLVLAGIGLVSGLSAAGLGLDLGRRRLLAGCAYGGAVMAVIGVVLALAALVPQTHHLFHNPRAEVTAGQMWFKALVAIPIGTVMLEELAFRGTLLGLMLLRTTTARAVAVTSVLFGLWHLQPVIASTHGGAVRVAAACIGTFVATVAAGSGFAWLRLRSGSLVASALAHLGTDSIPLVVAWLVVH